MRWTERSLENPAAVAVGVALIAVFGLLSLSRLPIQLFPDIEEPRIGIQTGWRSASPREIESEIAEPQEEVLQGLPGLEELEVNASRGNAWVNLRFALGTDMQATLIDVISRLNRLPPLPRDATPPRIQMSGGGNSNQSLTWFFVQLLPGTGGSIEDHTRFLEDVVKARIETVPGVSGVQVNAQTREELQILFDPYRAADLGILLPRVAALAGQADDVSAGFVEVGRRQYTVRFEGRYGPDELSNLVLDWRDGRPVHLGDVADISVRRADRQGFAVQNGNPAMSIRVDRENGANVLETLERVKEVVDELRDGPLADRGLSIAQSFDASIFIYRAIGLVTNNLGLGVLLAVGVLWLFLRRWRATLLVAAAIPISLLGTFIVLSLADRTLNVISLAGLAFAVGMVLDAAIVVLENIVRLREQGRAPREAAESGTAQVWGALVASTATTVAIFLPVLFLRDVEGQLFADLALTIAIAVMISLLVAVTILPAAARRWLGRDAVAGASYSSSKERPSFTGSSGGGARSARGFANLVTRLTDSRGRRLAVIATLLVVPVLATLWLLPELDYLPPVKRDAVDGFFNLPPGAPPEVLEREVVQPMVERLRPYMEGTREPALKNYYFILWPGGGTIGVRALDQSRVKELERIVRDEVTADLPDTRSFVAQGNLFGGFGGGRGISLYLQSTDPEALIAAAREGERIVPQVLPGAQAQAQPDPEMAEPELRLRPDDRAIQEAGWNRAAVGSVVRALGDGLWIGEHFDGEKRLDILLRGRDWATPEELASTPLVTPAGPIRQLGELVTLERTVGPSRILRIDRRRSLRLNVTPAEGVSLEETLAVLRRDVEPRLRALLPADGRLQYHGSADRLETAIRTMGGNFLLALLILFLLMSALFRSPKDSLLVVLAIPLATVGGVAAVRALNLVTFQPLDLLTMIGFIILLGLVVNNAILLVHQTRSAEREGLPRRAAVSQAVTVRLRPILMTTLTSIFGMLPLLLLPGQGSVIYRGLAAVIVGGMAVSTIFTLVLLPALLRLGEGGQVSLLRRRSSKAVTEPTRLRQAS